MATAVKESRTFDSGYFPVSDGHSLYYERYGNPQGKPVLFLHGGPGACCTKKDKRFFDPDTFDVLFFDQRGAGKSKPYGSIEANTTQKLIADIECLLRHFSRERVILFGGSWGTTLALVFAIQRPEMVSGMLLSGIFLGHRESIRHYLGGGVKPFFPEVWQRFISHVPRGCRRDPVDYYFQQMLSEDVATREKYFYEWSYYEVSIAKLAISHRQRETFMREISYRATSMLEAWYMKNDCFLEENYILRNAGRIPPVPVSIIHGRYDMICTPRQAFQLHRKLKNSVLHMMKAGHSSKEKSVTRKVVSEMQRISGLV